MTDSVHALIEARLGQADEAYETWRKSWREFTNHPMMLFSEKRRKEVTYFTTGAGGCLQTVLFGFAGLRIDTKAQEGSKWTVPLKNGRVLSCKPNMPKAWKSMTIRGLKVLGKSYTLRIGGDGSVVVSSEDSN
jgi:trehalose/maltose hydrolase-like predicted phosphorylase